MGRMKALAAAALLACWAGAAHAQQQPILISDDFQLSVGAGYSFIRGDELVFENGNRISHLIWNSEAPTLTANARLALDNGWTLAAKVHVAGLGTSRMKDYDWLDPFLVSYAFDDWTDRSIHEDTRLHHYFTGDIALGRDVALGSATLNLHGGVKYTDVSWTAMDGSFIYSWTGYRADVGDPMPGVRSISYQQRFPGVFLGTSLQASHGRWTFEGELRGGVALGASDTDFHWRRSLRFDEQFAPLPFVTAAVRASYQATEKASVFAGIDYERHFEGLGDTRILNMTTGDVDFIGKGGGAGLRALTLSAGLKLAF